MSAHRFTVTVACSVAFFSLAAFAPTTRAQNLLYCKADAHRLCHGIQPNYERIAKCLKAHQNEVSIGCAKELKKVKVPPRLWWWQQPVTNDLFAPGQPT